MFCINHHYFDYIFVKLNGVAPSVQFDFCSMIPKELTDTGNIVIFYV